MLSSMEKCDGAHCRERKRGYSGMEMGRFFTKMMLNGEILDRGGMGPRKQALLAYKS